MFGEIVANEVDGADEDDSDALLEGMAEVGFAAASLFRSNVGNHASTSAEVELEDGSVVYVTVTIAQG